MSLSSLSRPDHRAALLAALLLVASCWPSAATGATEELDIVAVVPSAGRQVSLIAELPPTVATPIRSEDFSVTAGDVALPTRAVPVISDQTAIGMIIDASAADLTAQQAGPSGAANFLLQMPLAARTTVVADTTPPTVIAPLETGVTGAVRALSAVHARGERATSDALTLVLRQLPITPGGVRIVVLYATGPDAVGVAAADLAERLASAGAVLAVITPAADTRYWSRVTTATGGLLVAARPSAVMAAFDEVAAALRARHVVTFQAPGALPTRVSVRLSTVDGTLTADADVSPGQDHIGRGERSRSASQESRDRGVEVLSVLALGVGGLVVVAAAALLVARRARSHHATGSEERVSPRVR
jgi:hypothetical protein